MRENLGFRVMDSITRPANTTQYAIGDSVTDNTARPFTFPDIAQDLGLPFWILKAFLLSTNVPATTGTFNLHLFRSKFDPAADNSAFAPTLTQLLDYIGTIVFDTAIKFSAYTVYSSSDFTPLYCLPGDNLDDIYGIISAGSTYTPASGERFVPVLIGSYKL
jgi:hypothetical protein